MIWTFMIRDLFGKPGGLLDDFAITQGSVVVDYGCGPGRYIRRASELVGPEGRVYAVDISRTAIDIVRKKMGKNNFNNVVPVLLGDGSPAVADHCADIVYALDMFHQIEDPAAFLTEIYRITKKDGVLFLEDGHQSRGKTKTKIARSERWHIDRECPRFIRLVPVESCNR
jgi:ubiquinone/menaquinone biosynthesis C-methylase UbiE